MINQKNQLLIFPFWKWKYSSHNRSLRRCYAGKSVGLKDCGVSSPTQQSAFFECHFYGEDTIFLHDIFPENLNFTRIICFKTEAGQGLFLIKALLKRPEVFNYVKLGTRLHFCAFFVFPFCFSLCHYIEWFYYWFYLDLYMCSLFSKSKGMHLHLLGYLFCPPWPLLPTLT